MVVGAPYWDLGFPAALKVYLEWACTLGITFGYTQAGEQRGLCRAERLIYITTAGGPLEDRNFGYEYVRGVAGMLGIINTHCVAAQGLDIRGNDPEAHFAGGPGAGRPAGRRDLRKHSRQYAGGCVFFCDAAGVHVSTTR